MSTRSIRQRSRRAEANRLRVLHRMKQALVRANRFSKDGVICLDASEYADAVSFLMDVIDISSDLLPSNQKAELKESLRDALLKSGGDPRADIEILRIHLRKAKELLREAMA